MFSIKKTTLNALENKYSIVKHPTKSSGPSGVLDTTFGPNGEGKFITDIDNKDNFSRSIEIDDTYIYVCGYTRHISSDSNGPVDVLRRFTIVRYKKDDYTLSPSIVNTHISHHESDSISTQLKLYNGSIYVSGYVGTKQEDSDLYKYDFVVVKYTSNLTLDNTFGTSGILAVSSGIKDINAITFEIIQTSIIVDDTGVYFSGAYQDNSENYGFKLFKCNHNGVLDNEFGNQGTGIVTTNIIKHGIPMSLQLNENYIYLAGNNNQLSDLDTFVVVRYDKVSGDIDMTFGEPIIPVSSEITPISGILADINSTGLYFLRNMKIDNTHIYLTGVTSPGITGLGGPKSVLVKYNKQNGILDTTFGDSGNGIVLNYLHLFTSIELDNDYLYLCGSTIATDNSINNVVLVRYRKNGVIDNTFGTQGTGIVLADSDFYGVGRSVILHNSYIYLCATRNSLSQTQLNDGATGNKWEFAFYIGTSQPQVNDSATGNTKDFVLYRYTNGTSEIKTIENKLVAIKFKNW